jgi:hypothetical protein
MYSVQYAIVQKWQTKDVLGFYFFYLVESIEYPDKIVLYRGYSTRRTLVIQ